MVVKRSVKIVGSVNALDDICYINLHVNQNHQKNQISQIDPNFPAKHVTMVS